MSKVNTSTGGALIISGTAIGAGMLALPITSYPLGATISSLLLFSLWVLMIYAAFVSLEIFLKFPSNYNIASVSKEVFGRIAELISLISISLLFYSLLAAYISASSEILISPIKNIFDLQFSNTTISCSITLIFAIIVFISTKAIDLSNRVLLLIKALFFIALIAAILPAFSLKTLLQDHANNELSLSIIACSIPVFFTSFGFHGSIPSIIEYMNRDHKKIKRAIFIGSIVPLVIFFIWNISVMGSLPNIGANYTTLGQFIEALGKVSSSAFLSQIISVFTWIAIITSFLGVSMSLFDFMMERLNYDNKRIVDRIKATLITFIPPLLVSISIPQLFISALGFAAIFLCVIAIIVPVGCAIKMNQRSLTLRKKISLWGALIVGILIILTQLYNIYGS